MIRDGIVVVVVDDDDAVNGVILGCLFRSGRSGDGSSHVSPLPSVVWISALILW